MSDFRAIGGVSATLQSLIADRMDVPDWLASVPPVTVGPPPFSSKDGDPRKEAHRLNLFLYRVTENGYLQNQEIPGRGSASGYGHPPLSLNLHYLLTAYGNQEIPANGGSVFDDLDAHVLLGSAMRVLHDIPIVTDELTSMRPPSGTIILHESLRDAYERVRLSLEPLTLEDVTKVWTALALRYRLSAAYVVNVVQIESRRPRSFPKPVGEPIDPRIPPLPSDPPSPGPWVTALTIAVPTIEEVRVRRFLTGQESTMPVARVDDTLILRGTNLAGPSTRVVFGDLSVPASLATPTLTEVSVPDNAIAGGGAIPPDRQLQPGVRTVRVVTRDPSVPGSTFTSADAVFMVVPWVDETLVGYTPGPPRVLDVQGSRLLPAGSGGETVIGRVTVPRAAYDPASSPTHLFMPIPPTLPCRGVQVVVSDPLPDPVPIGVGTHELRIDIDGTVATRTRNLPPSLPRGQVASIVASMIHDAEPDDPRFLDARVELVGNRLFVVPGDLTSPITIDSPAGSTFADDLLLTATPQPVGAADAYVSGVLGSPPIMSSAQPRVRLTIGAAAPVDVSLPKPLSLIELAAAMETAIQAFGGPSYGPTLVAVSGAQLLIVPGTADPVTFDPIPGVDDLTVVDLQLHARFSVRVRVNGAESVDPAVLELPQ
jgi:hypothetical protein